MKLYQLTLLWAILLISLSLSAQSKKKLTPDNYKSWNRIKDVKIATNGSNVLYTLSGERTNKELHIYNTRSKDTYVFPRADQPSIDYSGNIFMWKSVADVDTIREQKRRKVKKEELPGDSLFIFDVVTNNTTVINTLKSYKTPDEYGGFVAYQLEPGGHSSDSLLLSKFKKKESKEDGSRMILRYLSSEKEDTFYFVKDYEFAEEGKRLVYHTSGDDSLRMGGVHVVDLMSGNDLEILQTKGEVYHLTLDMKGEQLAFIVDSDTTEVRHRPYELYRWSMTNGTAQKIADNYSSFLPQGWEMSNFDTPYFSENGSKLFFGIAPPVLLKDSLILDDEIVNVEVWSHTDGILHTQQKIREKRDREKTYLCYYDFSNKRFVQLATAEVKEVSTRDNAKYAIGVDDTKYQQTISWLGYSYKDIYRIDMTTGESKRIISRSPRDPRMSPSGNYLYWFNREDGRHYSYDLENESSFSLTDIELGIFYDEENDRPMDPRSYGYGGWTADEEELVIYDRYDIWLARPNESRKIRKITNGRKDQIEYRIVILDKERDYLSAEQWLVRWINHKTKDEGYAHLNVYSGELTQLFLGPYKIDRSPLKAKSSNDIIWTKENYDVFPDLIHSDTLLQIQNIISNANPQQSEYSWGSIHMHEWKDDENMLRKGLLVLPDGFDPKKKYPLLVNFYERNSQNLHRHRAPYAHRSTINYAYYSSKGYILFNPDVYYKNGYPGKSSEVAVLSGVKSLIDKEFVDKDRIGVQGHSWGGYQVAHLLTKTDMFKCAESGAPVVNMISAYGGIRWGSGMSRQFQYEKTQSRLGATLWENPELYIENSPVFNLDKVNTPVLILHNDEDGAVPWYQGIEYFVGLRRLGKPAWMLNYNGEPHWPVKWQNRLDFNIRMEQFFDHYLMDAPMPRWMKRGVPALEKGILQGMELDTN